VADPCKTRKNACPASALFQCSLIRSDAAADDHKATPPPPMKNARRAAATRPKTTQRRRRPPVRRRTALLYVDYKPKKVERESLFSQTNEERKIK